MLVVCLLFVSWLADYCRLRCEHQMFLLVGWLSTLLFAARPSVWTSVVIVGGLVSCGLLICCLSVCFSLLLVGWLVGC